MVITKKNRIVLESIEKHIIDKPKDIAAYSDLHDFIRLVTQEDLKDKTKDIQDHTKFLREHLTSLMKAKIDAETTIGAADLLKKSYLFTAVDNFSDYMTYLEWERPAKERFWLPREKKLKPIANAMQALADDELDELFLSQPPRTGKTTLMLFYVTWLIGRNSERSNLYSAFSDTITSAFYNGLLEILTDPTTYLWGDVFPGAKITDTNAKEEKLNIGRRKRYPSITARSLYGTLNGACDANGCIISDDLIGGIEEALNKDRLISAWSKVDNNLIPRAKEGCKLLWIGTRWSISDPAGMRMNLLENDVKFKDHRYKIINVPALSETGHSNFNYDFGVGFSTQYYLMRKASFVKNNDEASWLAQYQGEPVERSGTLFERTEMKYFSELPSEDTLIRKYAACDPAFGGGDFCSMPICYQFESGTYVVDVVYSNLGKNITQPTIADRLIKWDVKSVQFECNASTVSFKEGVEKKLTDKGYKCNITFKAAPNNVAKEARIYEHSPEIREFYFLEGSKRNNEYEQFMSNLFSFRINGRNAHDDAPDSLAMCVDMENYGSTALKVRKRWF